jgi:glycosyltransferase involved in cell wall biosynthesis
MAGALASRTAVFDELLMQKVRHEGVDLVVNLAAGLDTRPWRLDLPGHLRWVDVDLPDILSYKADLMKTERAACRYPASTAATPVSRSWAELERSAYRNASMAFTMSGNISRSLIEDYGCPAQRVECVYAGSNVSAATFESIDSARFSSKNILFVGVDWERKGGPVLLDAFRRLRRSHPEARLAIVGCSPQVNEHGVEVVGRVSLTDVAQFYRKASIFCLPTLNEPFGLVFLEAFSYGLTIVATRLAGNTQRCCR